MRLIWSTPSIRDLAKINEWLAEQAGGNTADTMLAQIQARAARLLDFPQIGPAVEERTGARTLSVRRTPFILVYVTDDHTISILRVHHAREDWRPA